MQKIRFPTSKRIITQLSIGSLALWLEVSTLVLATAAFYSQDLIMIFTDAANNEATSYILFVPFALVYLVYRKRKMLRASITETQVQPGKKSLGALSGLLLCATAVLLYWHGSSTFTLLEYHMFTLPLFVSGLILIFFNPQTLRQAVFPIIFLFFLVPPSSEFLNTLGSTLSVVSSQASNALVNLLGVPTTLSTDMGTPTIAASNMTFTVDITYSGIYTLIGFLVFAAFIAFIVRDKTWKRATAFLIGLPLVFALNIIRIAILILIGNQRGYQTMLDSFHLLGGWMLIFLGTLILLLISEKAFKTRIFTRKDTVTSCLSCNPHYPDKLAAYCFTCGRLLKYPRMKSAKLNVAKMAAVALVVALLVTIQPPVLALTKGPAQILIQTPQGEQGNTQIFPQIPGYDLQFHQRDTGFEQAWGQNVSLVYLYSPQEEGGREPVRVGVEIADSMTPLYRWENLLNWHFMTHGNQPKFTQLDLHDVQILQNPPLRATYFVFNSTTDNQTGLVLYWYVTSVFTIDNASQQDNVMLSLLTFPDNVSATEEQLLHMAKAIAQYWQPIATWGTVALFLSSNGLTLAGTMAAFLAAILIFSASRIRKQKSLNQTTLQKLSKPNQQLIETIQKIEKSSTANLNRIREAHQQNIGQDVSNEKLQQELLGLEKTGLVQRCLINNQDSPVQVWRTDISKRPLEFRKGPQQC